MGQTQECQGLDYPVILCACGCGEKRPLYDQKGKIRRFIFGHSRRKVGDIKQILKVVIDNGAPSLAGKVLGLSKGAIHRSLRIHGYFYHTDLTKLGGCTAFGRIAELDALTILEGAVDATNNNTRESPFDILWNGLKIDVKASTVKISKNRQRWSFRTIKPQKCDAFLCLGYNKNLKPEVAFLIPSNIVPSCLTIPVSLNTKWFKYLFWGMG